MQTGGFKWQCTNQWVTSRLYLYSIRYLFSFSCCVLCLSGQKLETPAGWLRPDLIPQYVLALAWYRSQWLIPKNFLVSSKLTFCTQVSCVTWVLFCICNNIPVHFYGREMNVPLAFVRLSLWELVIFKSVCWCLLLFLSVGGFYLLPCFLLCQMATTARVQN